MRSKRALVWSALAAGAAFVLWFRAAALVEETSSPLEPTRAILVTGGPGEFWQLAVKGAEASHEFGVDLQVQILEQDEGVREQTQTLIALLDKPFDGCAISPLAMESQTLLINQLADKMDVVTFDSDAPMSHRRYYIGTSNYLAGKICYELVTEALPDGGKVLVLLANLDKNNMIHRKEGYEECDVAESWKTVGYLSDHGDQQQVRKNVQETLEKHPDLACVVGMNGYHGPLLRKLMADLGRLREVKLVVFDAAAETLAGVEAGEIYATVVQDPWTYGFEAIRMLAALRNGKSAQLPIVGRGEINIRCEPLRQADVADFRKRLQQRLNDDPPS